MATHSSILAWEMPWTEKPCRLPPGVGHKRVGHNLATKQQQQQQVSCIWGLYSWAGKEAFFQKFCIQNDTVPL